MKMQFFVECADSTISTIIEIDHSYHTALKTIFEGLDVPCKAFFIKRIKSEPHIDWGRFITIITKVRISNTKVDEQQICMAVALATPDRRPITGSGRTECGVREDIQYHGRYQ